MKVSGQFEKRMVPFLILFFFTVFLYSFGMDSSAALAADGDLDTTFDLDGMGVFDTGYADYGRDVAVQADGKIIAAGYSTVDGHSNFSIIRRNSDGSVDSSFGTEGTVLTSIGANTARCYATVIQPDGKIIAVGEASNGSDLDFAVVRYESDGALDTAFGTGGVVMTDIAGENDNGYAAALQSDGKIVVAGKAYNGSSYDIAVVRYNSDGTLDTSFGNGGMVITPAQTNRSAYDNIANAVAVQSDGKIVVAGQIGNTYSTIVIMRYTNNGTLDTTFNTDGKVITSIGGSANAVALRPDGKIIVAGSFNDNFIILRYNINGTLDTTFGANGRADTSVGSIDNGYAVMLQGDGKILAAGRSDNNFALVRYNNDGSPDDTFSMDGKLTTDFGDTELAYAAAFDNDGNIIVAGSSGGDYAIARYLASELANTAPTTNDDSYPTYSDRTLSIPAASGVISNDADAEGDLLTAIKLTDPAYGTLTLNGDGSFTYVPDGNYSGNDSFTYKVNDGVSDSNIATVNITVDGVDGEPDITFDYDGQVNINNPFQPDDGRAVMVQTDGKIVVGGSASGCFALVRHNSDGTLDYSFGTDGMVLGPEGAGYDMVQQPDGKIVLVGYEYVAEDFAVARYSSEGIPDSTFGTDGVVMTDIAGGTDYGYAVALQSDGKIVVAGKAHNGSNYDIAVVRYNSDGTIDSSFGNEGKVVTPAVSNTSTNDTANAVAVQRDGKIVVAGQTGADVAVLRYNSDGTLDVSFDRDGKIISSIADSANAVALQPDGKLIVVGTYSSYYNPGDFIILRCNINGTPDMTFGSYGRVDTSIGSTDVAYAVTLQDDGKIIAAGRSDNNFALVRYNSDGSLDDTFSTDGMQTTDFGDTDISYAAAFDNDGNIVAAGSSGSDLAIARYLASEVPNTAPTANDDSYLTYSDRILTIPAASGVIFNDADTQGDLLTAMIVTDPAYGTVTLNGDGSFTYIFDSTYGNDSTYQLFDSFTYKVNDGVSDSNIATVNITVDGIDGELDITFDYDGQITSDIINCRAVLVQPDGKIVAGGDSSGDFALVRQNSDGSLDISFGTDGKALGPNGTGYDIVQQPDGKIILAGYAADDFVVARYSSEGIPDSTFGTGGEGIGDSTFGTGGVVQTDIAGSTDYGYAVALQSDGKIVVAGIAYNGYDYDIAVVRYNSDGTLDNTFGVGGIVITPVLNSSWDIANAVTIQPDGKILVAGEAEEDTVLLRYNIDGSLDTTFDADGMIITAVSASDSDGAKAIAVSPDGTIIVAGYSSGDFSILRYNTNGALDSTFGLNGIVKTNVWNYDRANAVLLQEDGKIIAAGCTSSDFALVRYNSDGSLDETFSGNGKQTTDFGKWDEANAAAIDNDGNIILAGSTGLDGAGDFAIARYLASSETTNTAPTANHDSYSMDEDEILSEDAMTGVLNNDTDIDGQALTASMATPPTNGSLTLDSDGSFTYTPEPDYNGADSFTYTANDGLTDSNAATVTITIHPVNDPLSISGNPSIYAPDNKDYSFIPLATDPDSLLLTFEILNKPTWASFDTATGALTGAPTAADAGTTTGILISVSDGFDTASLAPFDLTVITVDDPPTISHIPNQITDENTPIGPISFTIGDEETPIESLTLQAASSNTSLVPTANILIGGTGADRTLNITPATNRDGTAIISISVNDGTQTATTSFLLKVVNINNVPIISDIPDQSTFEDLAAGPVGFIIDDQDSEDRLTLVGFSADPTLVPNSAIRFRGTGTDRTVSISPATDQFGQTTITVECSDGHTTVSDSFLLTISPINDPPRLVLNFEMEVTDGEINHSITENDLRFMDPENDIIILTLLSEPSNGILSVNGSPLAAGDTFTQDDIDNGFVSYSHSGGRLPDEFTVRASDGALDMADTVDFAISVFDNPPVAENQSFIIDEDTAYTGGQVSATDSDNDPITYSVYSNPNKGDLEFFPSGAFSYTPDPNEYGTDSFKFRAYDGYEYSEVATVFITINPVNDPPTAGDGTVTTTMDESVPVFLDIADPDHDPLTLIMVTEPANGIISGPPPMLTYTPNTGWQGSDNFSFTVSDGEFSSEIATVSITVEGPPPPNSAPVVQDGSFTTKEDTPYNGTLMGSDPDQNPLVFSVTTPPAHGTLEMINAGTGAFQYTPQPDFNGTDSFSFRANDGKADSNTAAVTIGISAVNDAPVISGIPANRASVFINYSFTPTASDIEGDPISFAVENRPPWADFDSATGTLSGIPMIGDIGSYSNIRVMASDRSKTASLPLFAIAVMDKEPIVSASPAGGSYNRNLSVELTCHDPNGFDCSVYYTTDGSAPTTASASYTDPIPINSDTVLRCIAVNENGTAGPIQSEVYGIDLNRPEIGISSPSDQSVVNELTALNGTATDAEGDLDSVSLQVTNGSLYLAEVIYDGSTKQVLSPVPSWVEVDIDNETGTWTYSLDSTSINWPSGTYTLTATASDPAGNERGASVMFSYLMADDQAYTRLTVLPSSHSILLDETVDVTGRLTRLPETGISLEGREINLTATGPTGAQNLTTNCDQYGNYTFARLDGFTKPGVYTLTARFAGTALLAPSSASDTVIAGASAGYAVVVQGRIESGEGIPSHGLTTRRIYRHLLSRGLLPENIRYFTYDTATGGETPTKSGIAEAVSSWPAVKMNGASAPFYLILVDHGSTDTFYVNGENEKITPGDIDGWFLSLEEKLNREALAEPRTLIIGACYSGTFIPAVSGPGRIIISSAASDEASYKGPLEWDADTQQGIRSGEFFMEELFTGLGAGENVKDAFSGAAEKTWIYTRRGGSPVSDIYDDGAMQHPLLDDNGDGFGTHTFTLENSDGENAVQLYLGALTEGETGVQSLPNTFAAVTETLYLGPAKTAAPLWCASEDQTRTVSAWAEVRAPSDLLKEAGGTATGQQVNELDKAMMDFNPETGRWETIYTGFTESGIYEIFYFMQYVTASGETGLSTLKRSILHKNRLDNNRPDPFDLHSPGKEESVSTTLVFDWADALDPDGDTVTYDLQIAEDNLFRKVVYESRHFTGSSAGLDSRAGLSPEKTYYWQVTATDPYGLIRKSSIRTFKTVYEADPPGIIEGTIYSTADFSRLSRAAVSDADGRTGISEFDGRFRLALPPGMADLTVQLDGYSTGGLPGITVLSGQIRAVNIGLDPGDLAAYGATMTTSEDVPLQEALTAEDLQARPFTYVLVQDGTIGSALIDPDTGHFTYTPATDANGTDAFTYKIVSGSEASNTARVTIQVLSLNDAPVMDLAGTALLSAVVKDDVTNSGTAVEDLISGRITDTDADALFGIAVTAAESVNGTWEYSTDSGNVWTAMAGLSETTALLLNADLSTRVRFVPDIGFLGSAEITFRAWDRTAGMSSDFADVSTNGGTAPFSAEILTAQVHVTEQNNRPTAQSAAFTIDEDTLLMETLTASDADGDPLSWQILTQPAKGSAVIGLSGTFRYQPALNFYGEDIFVYRVSDGIDVSNSATVTVSVIPVNDAPLADPDLNFTTHKDVPVAMVLKGTDVEDDPLNYTILTTPGAGEISGTGPERTYTPNPGWSGTDDFTYGVDDGISQSSPATVFLTVLAEPPPIVPNNAPTAQSAAYEIVEDSPTPLSARMIGSDIDPDSLTYYIITWPTKGTLQVNNTSTGEFTYLPRRNLYGSDSFTFRVSDGRSGTAQAQVSIEIKAVDDLPFISGNPPLTAIPGQHYNFTPMAGDPDGGTLTFSISGKPAWAQFSTATGALTGAPTGADAGVTRGIVISVTDGLYTARLPAFDLLTVADTTAPWTTAQPAQGLYTTQQEVTLTCTDTGRTGCTVRYTVDGTEPNLSASVYTGPIPIDTDTTIKYFAVDGDGNTESVRTTIYTFDTESPVVTIDAPSDGAAFSDRVVPYWISGTAFDIGSGIADLKIRVTDGIDYLQSDGTFGPRPVWLPALLDDAGDWFCYLTGASWHPGIYSATAAATDAAGNETEVSVLFAYSLTGDVQAFTQIDLSLSARAILQNNPLTLTGKLSRLPETTISLAGRTINLTVRDPDGTPVGIFANTTYDSYGHFRFKNLDLFPLKGSYSIEAAFADSPLLKGSQASDSVMVGTASGYAVLVQAVGIGEADFPSADLAAGRIYDSLMQREFPAEDILYLNHDTSAAGVDAPLSLTALQDAITVWAKARIEAAPGPLSVILVGHGESGSFQINGEAETLTPNDLAAWLDNLRTSLPLGAQAEPQIVILGANRSGSFIPAISGMNRLVIASAEANEAAFKGPLEDDGTGQVRAVEYFLEGLFDGLERGASFGDAFTLAAERTRTFTRTDGTSSNPFMIRAAQNPLLEDDGDGIGTPMLTGDSADGGLAEALYLGTGPGLTSGLAEIIGAAQTLYLGTEQSGGLLWVETDPLSPDLPPWAEIRTPSMLPPEETGPAQAEFPLTRVPLTFNAESNRWEGNWNGFAESGKYEIFYFVRDAATAALSAPARSLIYKAKAENQEPGIFHLLSPANGGETRTELIFDWEGAADPDGDPVTYTLTIASDIGFNTVVHREEEIRKTAFFFDGYEILSDLSRYYWKVEAVDPFGALTQSEEVWSFTTDNTNPVAAIFTGAITDITGTPVSGTITAGGNSFDTDADGYAIESLTPGTYDFTANVPGYTENTWTDVQLDAGTNAPITFDVQQSNTTPAPTDDAYTVEKGGTLTKAAPGLLANDWDMESDPLTAIFDSSPAHGTLNLNPDGSFTYTHDGNASLSDSFTYKASDSATTSLPATVAIRITVTDSDGDGLQDAVENAGCTDPENADTDGDGIADGVEDANGNGIKDPGETDPCLADTDGDTIPDGTEDANRNGIVDPGETDPNKADTDGDGIPDNLDPAPLDPAVSTRPLALPLNSLDSGEYGWNWGNGLHKEILTGTFAGDGQDRLLHVQSYDMDTEDEVEIWINDTLLGYLSGRSDAPGPDTLWHLPAALILPGENRIEFRQKNAGETWGITRMGIFDMGFGFGNLISAPDGDRAHPNGFEFHFSGGESLLLELFGYEGTPAGEIGMILNGVGIENLPAGTSPGWTAPYYRYLPAADMNPGENRLVFQNMADAGADWGVKISSLSAGELPPAPGVLDLADAADTGISSTDNLTRIGTGLTLTGTGRAGHTIQILDNGKVTPDLSPVIPDSGRFTVEIALTPGVHRLTARQIDPRGLISGTSAELRITVDTTPPGPPLVWSHQTITPSLRPQWMWDSGGGGNGNFEYRLQMGDSIIKEGTARTMEFTPAADLENGLHTLSVREADNAGNLSNWSDFPVTIDTGLPCSVAASPPVAGGELSTFTITYSHSDVYQGGACGDPTAEPGSGLLQVELWVKAPGQDRYTLAATDSAGNIDGSFTFDATPNLTGAYCFFTRAVDLAGNGESKSEADAVTHFTDALSGYALLAVGSTETGIDLPAYTLTADNIYRHLVDRGFAVVEDPATRMNDPMDHIRYLNPEPDTGIGRDRFIGSYKEALRQTLNGWAKEKMLALPGPLYLILAGPGESDLFHLNRTETLSAQELKGWLDTLEAQLAGAGVHEQVVILLGADQSGTFIDDLSGSDRIIAASAGAGEVSHKGALTPSGIRDGDLFLSTLFTALGRGQDLGGSFTAAVDLIERYTDSGSPDSIAPFFDTARQHPLIDDNGDGQGSNLLGVDGDVAEFTYMGTDLPGGAEPLGFTGTGTVPETGLKPDENTAQLWGKLNDPAQAGAVWAEIRAPQTLPTGGAADGIIGMARCSLPFDAVSNRYESSYEDFIEPGAYTLFFFVQDQLGRISIPPIGYLQKSSPVNAPPSAFSLILPAEGAETGTTLLLDWEDAIDPQGERVRYTVLVSPDDPAFADPMIWSGIDQSHLQLMDADGINEGTQYYWKVLATDEQGASTASEGRGFATAAATAPPLIRTGWLQGYVFNTITGAGIPRAELTIESAAGTQHLNAEADGSFSTALLPDTYTVTAGAENCPEQTVSGILLQEEEITRLEIGLTPNQVQTPTFSPAPGTYTTRPTVTLTSATAGAAIRYTTDGTDPTESAALYENPIGLSGTITLRARAFKAGLLPSPMAEAHYAVTSIDTLPAPLFSLAPGTYTAGQTVTLSCEIADAQIRYTTDGRTPDETSPLYTGPISLTASTTLRTRAFKEGWYESGIAIGTYIITGKVPPPDFSPAPGSYDKPVSVRLSSTLAGALIRYTLDGTDPGENASLYTEPIPIPSGTVIIKARASHPGWETSDISSGEFIITGTVELPILSPSPGIYPSAQEITLSCPTPGAVIRYTLDGTIPNHASTPYTDPIRISADTEIQAIGFREGWDPSPSVHGYYSIFLTAAPPDFSPPPGIHIAPCDVTLTSQTPGATIFFTTDGTDPTEAASIYTEPIPITGNTLLKARTYKVGMTPSRMTAGLYRIIGRGDLNGDQSVNLADVLIGLKILSGIDAPVHIQGDPDESGRIDIRDVLFILRSISGIGE